MTEIEFAIVVLLAVAGGWVIGIVGFAQAIMARKEIAQLRGALADLRRAPGRRHPRFDRPKHGRGGCPSRLSRRSPHGPPNRPRHRATSKLC